MSRTTILRRVTYDPVVPRWIRIATVFQGIAAAIPVLCWLSMLLFGGSLSPMDMIFVFLIFFMYVFGPTILLLITICTCMTSTMSLGQAFFLEIIKSFIATGSYILLVSTLYHVEIAPWDIICLLELLILFYPALVYTAMRWYAGYQESQRGSSERDETAQRDVLRWMRGMNKHLAMNVEQDLERATLMANGRDAVPEREAPTEETPLLQAERRHSA